MSASWAQSRAGGCWYRFSAKRAQGLTALFSTPLSSLLKCARKKIPTKQNFSGSGSLLYTEKTRAFTGGSGPGRNNHTMTTKPTRGRGSPLRIQSPVAGALHPPKPRAEGHRLGSARGLAGVGTPHLEVTGETQDLSPNACLASEGN